MVRIIVPIDLWRNAYASLVIKVWNSYFWPPPKRGPCLMHFRIGQPDL